LESARDIKYVVFDKTGTLTVGKPVVTDVVGEVDAALGAAAALEAVSEHPLAGAILEKAGEEKIASKKVENFEVSEGKGVVGTVAGKSAAVGNRALMKDLGVDAGEFDERMKALEAAGKTVMMVAVQDKLIGLVGVRDEPKPTAAAAIIKLRAMGFESMMITGDNQATASAIARQVGITRVIAEVLPVDKASRVKALQQTGRVAFVGDGINDAPAMAEADLGIAMGNGTDIAMEAGGIVLVKGDLLDVPRALSLSHKTFARIRLNLFWAFVYNLAGIPVAAGVFSGLGITLNPVLAGLAMAFSSVSVVTSSLLLRYSRL
jgi:Cu+-exporting ATPase